MFSICLESKSIPCMVCGVFIFLSHFFIITFLCSDSAESYSFTVRHRKQCLIDLEVNYLLSRSEKDFVQQFPIIMKDGEHFWGGKMMAQ